MPDLVPAPFSNLLKRAYYEPQRQQTIYDLPLKEMYRGSANVVLSTRFHGLPAGTPLGPAAGPQDQFAQNLVLAWLGGSRIIEMKTIQILDELVINRPCIDATNIGFNIEWSQELKLHESLLEYVKGLMIIEILREENALGVPDPSALPPDFYATIFDLSIGYDLKGIQSEAVTGFIQQIKNAGALVDQLRSHIPTNTPAIVATPSAPISSKLPRFQPSTVALRTRSSASAATCSPKWACTLLSNLTPSRSAKRSSSTYCMTVWATPISK